MTDAHNPADVQDRLWKEIKKQRFGMLGLAEARQHYQPMTAFSEPETGQLWFFTARDSDLARAIGEGAKAMFIIQAKDQDIQACLGGQLTLDHDEARIDKYWGPMVAAWFPEGRADARLTLIRMDLSDAAVWLTEAGPVRMAFEIAKANINKTQPDLGDRANVDFRH
jgi:general stress protein 26